MTAEPQINNSRKERLRRLDRMFAASPIYFVTACTFERRRMLAVREMHQAFLRFAAHREKHGAYVGSYFIMPDHVHFFVALDKENNLSTWMKSLKNPLSKRLRTLNLPSPHWQKGFFDHVLRSEESCSQKWIYVRDNPVRAELMKRWEEWPFSGEVWPVEYRE